MKLGKTDDVIIALWREAGDNGILTAKEAQEISIKIWEGSEYDGKMCLLSLYRQGLLDYANRDDWQLCYTQEELENCYTQEEELEK